MKAISLFYGAVFFATTATAGPLRRTNLNGFRNIPRELPETEILSSVDDLLTIIPIVPTTTPETTSVSTSTAETPSLEPPLSPTEAQTAPIPDLQLSSSTLGQITTTSAPPPDSTSIPVTSTSSTTSFSSSSSSAAELTTPISQPTQSPSSTPLGKSTSASNFDEPSSPTPISEIISSTSTNLAGGPTPSSSTSTSISSSTEFSTTSSPTSASGRSEGSSSTSTSDSDASSRIEVSAPSSTATSTTTDIQTTSTPLLLSSSAQSKSSTNPTTQFPTNTSAQAGGSAPSAIITPSSTQSTALPSPVFSSNSPSTPESSSTIAIVSKVTEIPSVLPAPTQTMSVSPAQASVNLEQAKEYNKFFSGLESATDCSADTIACIEGNIGICTDGKFVMTICGAGTKCFAMPMKTTAGVSVGCVDEDKAGEILGGGSGISSTSELSRKTSTSGEVRSMTSTESETTTELAELPSTIVLTQRPPTTEITRTPDPAGPPSDVLTTLTLETFTPSDAVPQPTSGAPEQTSTREVEPSTTPKPSLIQDPVDGDGQITTTFPFERFTGTPIVTGLPEISNPPESLEQPPPQTFTRTALPVITTIIITQTEEPAIETESPTAPLDAPPATATPQPEPTPTAIGNIPDFDFLTIIPMPTDDIPSPSTVTVTRMVTTTERITEKETVFVTVTA